MKNLKIFLTLLQILLLVGGIFVLIMSIFHRNDRTFEYDLSSPIVIGSSGLNLTDIKIYKSKPVIVFSGAIPANTGSDLNEMKSFSSELPEPYIKYDSKKGTERLENIGFSFSHVKDVFKREYMFNKIPKNAEWFSVIVIYKNEEGKEVEFKTQRIEL